MYDTGRAAFAQARRSPIPGERVIDDDLAARARAMPTYFIPHGGGPCFFMDWPGDSPGPWDSLAGWLRGLRASLPKEPRAILVVSAHWEAAVATVTARRDPPLIYDYSGFPPHTYALRYPAPGSPELASRVRRLLAAAGIPSMSDDGRGFDHGVFVPFMLVAPEAEIPVVQLSLVAGLDPGAHVALGRALSPLRREGVLIVGSGMSYHNMRGFFGGGRAPGSARFDAWLTDTMSLGGIARDERLLRWKRAPDAGLAHPREEHLLPLMVAAGAAASEPAERVFHDTILGAQISGYRFGAAGS